MQSSYGTNINLVKMKQMKTGNKYLRYYLVQAADSIRRSDSEYQAFYQKKYQEVTKHQHKRALVLTARKLVRLVFSLLKTNQLCSLDLFN